MIIYVVSPGDTLFSIADQYDLSVERVIADNGILTPSRLAVGQALILRIPDRTVTVREGETLTSLARANQTDVITLYRNNPTLTGREELIAGEEIVISYLDEEPIASLYVNGYTYPSIEEDVLRTTLPYLSYVTSFSYGFLESGELIAPNDERVLQTAEEYSARPIMLLSTLRENGSFSSDKANLLLRDETLQQRVIDSVIREMQEKGFRGIDVDFEYVDPSLREEYAAFIGRLRQAAGVIDKLVFVSLAPKTSSEQRGLQYEAHDYALLGAASDRSLLMTYEWGYRFSEPMAVAPIRSVRRVVDYAISQISPEKIFLGLPSYGYDWPLPFVRGESEGRSLSNPAAMDLAARYGAIIEYDEVDQSPHFVYTAEDGSAHEVWFEDVRSVRAKLALVSEYRLGGVSVWNMLRYFPGIWSMIDATVEIRSDMEEMGGK